jgi:pimeloyl-ACP methyl ester carboxylesterase
MEELRVERDAASLAVTYSPAGSVAVVALHGAGAGTRDFELYRHLHELLPPAGIGVATFDRRGDGESSGEPSRGRFLVQADDALAVLAALAVERAGLWGISQGGWVAPLAATRSDRVAFLVLLASTGVTPAEQMRYAVREQLTHAGHPTEVAERAVRLRVRAEEWLRTGQGRDALRAELRAASSEQWWPLAFLPDDIPDDDAVRTELAEEMFFEPEPVFAQVRVPTLLFFGEDDEWTPVDPSIAAWRRARGDEVDVVVLPGTGHEPTLADGTISPDYERTLVEWLRARS